MAERGVTRPTQMMHGGGEGHAGHGAKGHEHEGHAMSESQRREMLAMHHKKTLWIYWTLVMLALWLLTSPFTFGCLNEELWVDPSGGRVREHFGTWDRFVR